MEKWLPVPNYEGLYEVSNLGKIKSINYNHTKVEKLLSEKSHKSGYKTVQFVKEYSPKSLRNREGFWYNRRKPPREAPSWKSTPKTPAAKQWLLT